MKAKENQSLASRLAANPNFLRQMEEESVRDFLLAYTTGLLEPEIEKEARELIASDPVAGAIWKEFTEIEARLQSPEGQQWVNESGERILSNVLKAAARDEQRAATRSTFTPPPAFLDALSDWLAGLFPSLLLQDAYSDTTAESTAYKFTAPAGSPYRAQLERDAAGQWRFFVFTSSAEAAKLKVRLKIEEEAPILSFVEGATGHFMAEVLITEDMAKALQSGSRPAFPPVG